MPENFRRFFRNQFYFITIYFRKLVESFRFHILGSSCEILLKCKPLIENKNLLVAALTGSTLQNQHQLILNQIDLLQLNKNRTNFPLNDIYRQKLRIEITAFSIYFQFVILISFNG